MVTNPKLEQAIEAVGGVVAVAFYLKKTPGAVYKWRHAGRVFDVQDALRIQALAAGNGCRVTIEELAGLAGETPNGGKGKRVKSHCTPRPTSRSVTTSPTLAAPTAVVSARSSLKRAA